MREFEEEHFIIYRDFQMINVKIIRKFRILEMIFVKNEFTSEQDVDW
jgi:hypothetical protein